MKQRLVWLFACMAVIAVVRSAIEATSPPRVPGTAVPAAVARNLWLVAANRSGQTLEVAVERNEIVSTASPNPASPVKPQAEHWAALGAQATATELADASMAALSDADAETRVQAIELLGDARRSQYVTILAAALADTDRDVRLAAAHALVRHDTDEARGVLRAGLPSFDEDTRQFSLAMLADVRDDATP